MLRITYKTVKGVQKQLEFKSVSDACMKTGIPYNEVLDAQREYGLTIGKSLLLILENRLGTAWITSYDITDPDNHMEPLKKEVKKKVESFNIKKPTEDNQRLPPEEPLELPDNSFLYLEELYPEVKKLHKEYTSIHKETFYGVRLLFTLQVTGASSEEIAVAREWVENYSGYIKQLDGSNEINTVYNLIFFVDYIMRKAPAIKLSYQRKMVGEDTYLNTIHSHRMECDTLTRMLALVGIQLDCYNLAIEIVTKTFSLHRKRRTKEEFKWDTSTSLEDRLRWVRLQWTFKLENNTIIGRKLCLDEALREPSTDIRRFNRKSTISNLLGRELDLIDIDRQACAELYKINTRLNQEVADFSNNINEYITKSLRERQEIHEANKEREKQLEAEAKSHGMSVTAWKIQTRREKARARAAQLAEQRRIEQADGIRRKIEKEYTMESSYMQIRTEGPTGAGWGTLNRARTAAQFDWWYRMPRERALEALELIQVYDVIYTPEDLISVTILAYKQEILAQIKQGKSILEAILLFLDDKRQRGLEDTFDAKYAVRCFGITSYELDAAAKKLLTKNNNLDPTEAWIQAATKLILQTETA